MSATDEWIGSTYAARLLGCSPASVAKVARIARVRVRNLPGIRYPRYFRPDLERVAQEAETKAAAEAVLV